MQSLADAILGRQPTMQEQILGQIYDVDTSGGSSLLDSLGGLLSGLFDNRTDQQKEIDETEEDLMEMFEILNK
jgi:hypothetical protein